MPLHELGEGPVGTGRELGICALFRDTAIRAETDDAVRSLDRRQTMSDADGSVVTSEQSAESLVDERFRLGIQGTGGFVQNQNVGLLEKGACDGDALFLTAGELRTPCANVGFKTVGLSNTLVFRTQLRQCSPLTKSLMN